MRNHIRSKFKEKQQVLIQKLQQVIQILTKIINGCITLSGEFLRQAKQLLAIYDFHIQRSQCLASKDRLTLVGANGAGDFKVEANAPLPSRILRIGLAHSALSVPYNWNNKLGSQYISLYITQFTEYFRPTAENYDSEKQIPFKI